MKKIVILFILIFSYSNVPADESQLDLRVKPLTIGETLTIESKILNESRRLVVYLPASYDQDSNKDYPVIYLLDGGMDEDFLHMVGIVQFNSVSWLDFMPESIVVGIKNIDRKRDFTFKSNSERDNKEFPTSGGSDKFIPFLLSEVIPSIEQRYRVSEERTLIGQSLGGLFATQILFSQPDSFQNYLIVSPSLWWSNELLLSQEIVKSAKQPHVFVAVGNEGTTMVRLAISLADKLRNAYQNADVAQYAYFDDLTHGDVLHLATYKGLQALYADQKREK